MYVIGECSRTTRLLDLLRGHLKSGGRCQINCQSFMNALRCHSRFIAWLFLPHSGCLRGSVDCVAVCCFSWPSCEGSARTKTPAKWDRWLRYRDKSHSCNVSPNQKQSTPNLFLLLAFVWFPKRWMTAGSLWATGYMVTDGAEMRTIVRKGYNWFYILIVVEI